MNPNECEYEAWDAVIVGTGISGSTLGYALATKGLRVLFIEKGKSHLHNPSIITDRFPEEDALPHAASGAVSKSWLENAGRVHEQLRDHTPGRPINIFPLLGSGTGGSSALYGGAMERFHPIDFHPGKAFPNAAGASIVPSWPIDFHTLQPYYRKAEELFEVHGTTDPMREQFTDPLSVAPNLPECHQEIFQFLESEGLHPYVTPVAARFKDKCSVCQGFLCSRDCKVDASNACLTPALDFPAVELLDQCEAQLLESEQDRVTRLICKRDGQSLRFRARFFVLAAGALFSPCILLNSKNRHHPNGLANGSNLVGKNLMRHYVDLVFLKVRTKNRDQILRKCLSTSAFYTTGDGGKYGLFHTMGQMPPPSMIVASMGRDLREKSLWKFLLMRPFLPLLRFPLTRLTKYCVMMHLLYEDLPFASNRVFPTPEGIGISYSISREEKGRLAAGRRRLKKVLGKKIKGIIKLDRDNHMLAHACGTCRFGHDPESSVLDPHNRAHDLENLYVVDSSFFPSSTGTNPSLTLAANALRVADHLTQVLSKT